MNQNIKYLVESILDDFYDDEQFDIVADFIGYKYFPKNKNELQEIIKEHYKEHNYNLNDIDVSLITDFSKLFQDDAKTGNEDFDISYWDVSNGEDFSHMFHNCYRFNGDLSKWDVSRGNKFNFMFCNCQNFNSDLSKWDVSNGEDFSHMFHDCYIFNCDLSKWDVSSGENFKTMFFSCYIFNCDLSKWDVSSGENFETMFFNCQNFNSDLSKWDVSEGTEFEYMFCNCKKFNSDLSKWNISDYVIKNYEVKGMFTGCESLNNKFIPKRLYNYKIIYESKYIKYLDENILDDFYNNEQSNIIEDFLGYKYFPKDKDELQEIIKEHYKNNIFNLNDIEVSQITDFSKVFYEDDNTGNEKFDISHWDVRNGKNFSYMFYDCQDFNCDLSKWDVSRGIDFSYMFYGCNEFDANLSNWNLKKSKFLSSMFLGCTKFYTDFSKWPEVFYNYK